jgi:hypothetical protein
MMTRSINMRKAVSKNWEITQKKRKFTFGKKKQIVIYPAQRENELSAIAAFIEEKGVTKCEIASDIPVNGVYGTPSPKTVLNWKG